MLVYYLANMNNHFVEEDLNFYSKFNFNYDSQKKSLNIILNKHYLINYWGSNITSVTTIAGENGVGKTSILEMIKNRFNYGLNHTDYCILIYQINNVFKIYYGNKNLEDKTNIKINNKSLDLNNNSKIFSQNNFEFEGSKFEIYVMNHSEIESQSDLTDLVINSRIGNNHALIYHTNHWNYSKYHRDFREDIKTKGLDYYDFSIANRIDDIIHNENKYVPPIADVDDIYRINKDDRFPIDYLYKLKEQEISSTLNYLSTRENRTSLSKYFTIPEEIYIYPDFMNSDKRGFFMFPSMNIENNKFLLRFENHNNNFVIETPIYQWIFSSIDKRITLKHSLILTIIERFFYDLDVMTIGSIKNKINKITPLVPESYDELPNILEIYESKIIDIISETTEDKLVNSNTKNKLQKNISGLCSSYREFLKYILNIFSKENYLIATVLENVTVYFKEETTTLKSYEIEIPKINLDDKGMSFALEFFDRYSKIKSINKPFYFVWRNLSSGEYHLLNLLAFLDDAISKTHHQEVIVLFDEVELSLHPTWQKGFVKLIIDVLNTKAKKLSKKIQIIITTHSPFLLSDMPAGAILLLEKTVDHKSKIKYKLDSEFSTLGANIHELYSSSFFLKDGLIGDYSKDKINEVAELLINYLPDKGDGLNWRELRIFINQVAEPRIKARLIELYEQKKKLSMPIDEEIQSLKGQINILTNRLNDLESNKGENR